MNGLGQSQLEDLRLQATLEEVLDLQTEHVIELHARLVQHTDADQTTQQRVTWKRRTGRLSTDRMVLVEHYIFDVWCGLRNVFFFKCYQQETSDKRCHILNGSS